MAFCSNCGNRVEGESRFCSSCGQQQGVTMHITSSPSAPAIRVVEPKRGGRLALVCFLAVLVMMVIFNAANQGHSTSIGTAIAAGIGAAFIILTLIRWKRNSEVIRGQVIAGTVGVLLLLSAVGGLLGTQANNTSTETANTASGTESDAPEKPHYAMKQTVHVGYWSYAVWSMKWQNSIGTDFMAERPDADFLVVWMTVRNNDKTSSTLPPITLIDSQGREYESTSKGSFSEGFFGPLKSLNPGVESSGAVAFDVPKGVYSLKVSGGFTSGDNALIDLP